MDLRRSETPISALQDVTKWYWSQAVSEASAPVDDTDGLDARAQEIFGNMFFLREICYNCYNTLQYVHCDFNYNYSKC